MEDTYFPIIADFPVRYAQAMPNDRMSMHDFENAAAF